MAWYKSPVLKACKKIFETGKLSEEPDQPALWHQHLASSTMSMAGWNEPLWKSWGMAGCWPILVPMGTREHWRRGQLRQPRNGGRGGAVKAPAETLQGKLDKGSLVHAVQRGVGSMVMNAMDVVCPLKFSQIISPLIIIISPLIIRLFLGMFLSSFAHF